MCGFMQNENREILSTDTDDKTQPGNKGSGVTVVSGVSDDVSLNPC